MGVVGTLMAIDHDIAAWLQAHTSPVWTEFMRGVSALHGPRHILAATLVVVLLLWWRRRLLDMAIVLVVVLGGATLNHVLKHSVQRARPNAVDGWAGSTDFSFPSGHVANSTLLYGVVAALLIARTKSRLGRLAIGLAAAVLVLAVAVSRMVLGAHYLSDVVAGALVGLFWLALCLLARRRWRRARRMRQGPDAPKAAD